MTLVHIPYVPASGLHDMSLSYLTDQLQLFASVHGLPEDGAETLLGREDITSSQREWLEAFIAAWDIQEAAELARFDVPFATDAGAHWTIWTSRLPDAEPDYALPKAMAPTREIADQLAAFYAPMIADAHLEGRHLGRDEASTDEPRPICRASALLDALSTLYPGVDVDVMLRSVHADLRHVADALGADHAERCRAGHETYTREVAEFGALTPDDGKDVL